MLKPKPGKAAATPKPAKTVKRQVETESVTKNGRTISKPKRAASAYMLFCHKIRPDVMATLKFKYGSTSLPDIARELGERWADLDEKDKKKYEKMAARRKLTHQSKMEAYQEIADPISFLKKKYEHLIPKRPSSAYFLFNADPATRQKAVAALKAQKRQKIEGGEEAGICATIAEMWKNLPAEKKEMYEKVYTKEKAVFEKKNIAWQKTKEFAELNKLEMVAKEAERADRQAQKVEEQAEIQELLKQGVAPGQGLAAGRSAFITGLTSRADLNDKEVTLIDFNEDTQRWSVTLLDSEIADEMRIRPVNLLLSLLQKEAERAQKKTEDAAVKAQLKEEQRTIKEASSEAQRAAKAAEKEAEKATKDVARAAIAAEKEAERVAQAAEKEEQRKAEQVAKAAIRDEYKEVEKVAKAAAKEAEKAARDAAKEAERAALDSAKEQERAAKAAAKEAARALNDAAKEAKEALKAAARERERAFEESFNVVVNAPVANVPHRSAKVVVPQNDDDFLD